MTAYALRLESDTDTAARVRLGDLLGLTPAGPLTARSGIRPAPTAGDVAVSAGTMNVTVQPFTAWVQGGVSAAQGGYPFVLDAVKTLTLANGHATLSRTDVVAVVIHDDPYDGSGLLDADVVVVPGTPGAGAPALPTNCLPLRNITVPAGASAGTGGLVSGNLSTDRRTYLAALGGVVTVASLAERDGLPQQPGTVVYRKDTDTLEVRTATGWQTWAGVKGPALGILASAQATADQTGLAGSADIAGLSVTFTAQAGRLYKITGVVHLQTNGGDVNCAAQIAEGATVLGSFNARLWATSSVTCTPIFRGTFTAGAHTVRLTTAYGGGVNTSRANAASPAYIIVEDAGPA